MDCIYGLGQKGLLAIAILTFTGGISSSALAQSFPTKPIRVVIGGGPGGGLDFPMRRLGETLSPGLGQPVILDFRPGAGSTIAANAVAKAEPDGYTLLFVDPAPTINAKATYNDLPYDPLKDLTVVSPILRGALLIIAGPGSSANSLRELLDQVKANPGKISYAIPPGAGSTHHLIMELFKKRLGIAVNDLPPIFYAGGSRAVQDTAGGFVPLIITGFGPSEPLVKAGKLRRLAVSSKERFPGQPDIPSFSEFSPGFDAYSWCLLWAPSATPRPVLERLNAEVAKALRNPEIVKAYNELSLEATPRTLAESNQLVQSEYAIWPDLIRQLGIKPTN